MLKQKLYAFIMGMKEFRSDFTMNFEDENGDDLYGIQEYYDRGRDFAHKMTFRKFDQI